MSDGRTHQSSFPGEYPPEFGNRVFRPPSPGVSEEAEVISALIREISSKIQTSHQEISELLARGPRRLDTWKKVFSDLEEIKTKCTQENWDGDNAKKISEKTVLEAQKFLDFFPGYLPFPDIAPETDGFVSLEWFVDLDFLFEISIDEEGQLFYVGRNFGSKFHGTEKLKDQIPPKIIEFLRPFQHTKLSK